MKNESKEGTSLRLKRQICSKATENSFHSVINRVCLCNKARLSSWSGELHRNAAVDSFCVRFCVEACNGNTSWVENYIREAVSLSVCLNCSKRRPLLLTTHSHHKKSCNKALKAPRKTFSSSFLIRWVRSICYLLQFCCALPSLLPSHFLFSSSSEWVCHDDGIWRKCVRGEEEKHNSLKKSFLLKLMHKNVQVSPPCAFLAHKLLLMLDAFTQRSYLHSVLFIHSYSSFIYPAPPPSTHCAVS